MFDYNKIKNENICILYDTDKKYDINFLIPVRNRLSFAKPMYDSFVKSRDESNNISICYTVIEHSETPQHSKFCKENKINYIWIESNPNEMFNKCLCYNVGALFSNYSKYLIFHDIDCIIQKDFFKNILLNIENQKCKAMQCFQQRRVLYCNEKITNDIINKNIDINNLSLENENIDLPRLNGIVMLGAPGGSITVERNLFYDTGGYDDDLFLGNSPEDAYFWEKIDTIDKMYKAENPCVDIFHLYHTPTYYSNPYIHDMEKIYNDFKILSKEQKKEKINKRAEYFKKFIVF